MFLSRAKKLKGQKSYLSYTFVNGLGYSFMAETIIYLLAIHFGADNLSLGYISSAVYLTGAVIIFVPVLFPGVRIVSLFFVAWMLRGVVCLLYGLTFYIPPNLAVILIVLIYTAYCLLRNMAYPFNPVIQGIITKPSERGEFSSRMIAVLYTSMMLSRFISFSVLSVPYFEELEAIVLLLGMGIILNTVASFAIRKVPVEESIERQSLGKLLTLFLAYLKTPRYLVFILLYCGGMSLIVLFNFTIPFLKKVADVQSNLIFIFTTINFAGVILSSRVARPFLDRFGSKPQLTLVSLAVAVLSIPWILGPDEMPLWGYFILGFISMYFIGMVRLLLERLVVNMIPADDRIGFTSTLSVVFSLVALFAGLAGGALADLSLSRSLPVFHDYSLTFVLMGALAMVNFFLSLFLKEEGSLSANQFLTVMTNPKHLKTIHNVDLLKRISNPARKESILIELESDQSHLATQEIRKRLHQATLRDKEMILRSLFSCPRPELEDDLIREAMDRDSWWRQSAIFALGAYPTDKSREALRKVMREKSPYISSVAAKSMARVGDNSAHDKILDLLERERLDVRICLNLIIALSLMEKNGRYWQSIFNLVSTRKSHRFTQSLMIIGSRRQNYQPPIEDLFYELNLSEEGGFDALLEDMVDLKITEEEFNTLVADIENREFASLWSWSRNRCKALSVLQPHEFLRESIVNYRKRTISPSLALAGLYFTLQLENISRLEKGPVKY